MASTAEIFQMYTGDSSPEALAWAQSAYGSTMDAADFANLQSVISSNQAAASAPSAPAVDSGYSAPAAPTPAPVSATSQPLTIEQAYLQNFGYVPDAAALAWANSVYGPTLDASELQNLLSVNATNQAQSGTALPPNVMQEVISGLSREGLGGVSSLTHVKDIYYRATMNDGTQMLVAIPQKLDGSQVRIPNVTGDTSTNISTSSGTITPGTKEGWTMGVVRDYGGESGNTAETRDYWTAPIGTPLPDTKVATIKDSWIDTLGPMAVLALATMGAGGMLGGLTGGATTGTTTAASMLAEQSAAMLAEGFTAADVAASLAGLGNAGQIASILTAAGIPATTAASLATDALVNSGLMTPPPLVGPSTGSAAPGTPGVSTVTPVTNPYANITATDLTKLGLSASDAATAANAIKTAAATGAVTLTGNPTIDGLLTTLKNNAGWIAPAANIAGGLLQTDAAKDAAQIQANAQLEAAKIAADAAKFRPVGVTTRFGQSQFGYDANGNLTSAGYTLDPTLRAQQDQLLATSGGLLNQFTGTQAATAPMGTAAQSMMNLGQGYLSTSPQEQAAKYMADQQALLAPTRERQLASTLAGEQARGTMGLAVGGTSTGLMAANPRLEALYNAQRMQDLQLATQATQGGMDYSKFGAGMVGAGGQMLQDMYGTQAAAYKPYQTALGGAQTIEGLGQNAMDLGISLGSTTTAANRAAGGLLASGMANAANTVGAVNQAAGSTWGNLLQGGSQALQNWATPTQQQQAFKYDPYTGKLLGA